MTTKLRYGTIIVYRDLGNNGQTKERGVDNNLYEKIRKLLEARNESFSELSRHSGVPLHTLYNLKTRPDGSLSLRNLLRLSQHFGITLDELCEVEHDNG